jgi:hypothetical protein
MLGKEVSWQGRSWCGARRRHRAGRWQPEGATTLHCFHLKEEEAPDGQVGRLGWTEVAGPSRPCGLKRRRWPSVGERRRASLEREVHQPKAKAGGEMAG